MVSNPPNAGNPRRHPLRSVSWSVLLLGLWLIGMATSAFAQEPFHVRWPTRGTQARVPDELLVKFTPEASEALIGNVLARHGLSIRAVSRFSGVRRVKIPVAMALETMLQQLSQEPTVEYVEPNYIAHAFWVPNDPYYRYQWHLDNTQYGGIEAEQAWDLQFGNPNTVVAIVDTGVAYEDFSQTVRYRTRRYYRAPDLAQTTFVSGYDFVNDDTHPNDDEGHGTHVTGTIAQSTHNGQGAAGIAFQCAIMPVKVLDARGSGTYADVADGIRFAADQGADVINLSLGGSAASATLKNALAYALSKGTTLVCAAGNDGSTTTISYPSAYEECIAVGGLLGVAKYLSAAAAFTRPYPYVASHPGEPLSSAVTCKMCRTSAGVAAFPWAISSAATPLTCGVAMDVPW